TEAVGHHGVELHVITAFAHDRHVGNFGIKGVDVGRSGDEVVLHHQDAVDGFLYAGCAEGVAGQRLGGADGRHLVTKGVADGLDFLHVTHGRAGAVGVDVVDRAFRGAHCHLHAAHGAFARGSHHVGTIRGGAITGQFGVDGRTAGQGVVEGLDDQHTTAAGNDEAVAVHVIGARGAARRGVVLGGEGTHGVEHAAQGPVFGLAAAGEDHVLLAELDQLHGIADAMRTGGAGGGNRIVDALDAEGRGQTGGYRAAHRARDAVGADALEAFLAQHVSGFHLVFRGGPAGTHDDAGARVGYHIRLEAGVGDGLLQCDITVGRGCAHEAQVLAVDVLAEIHLDGARHVAAHAALLVLRAVYDAAFAFPQRGKHGLQIASDTGNDPHAGHYNTTHIWTSW